ncbi:hypothetical protein XENOCAPTIV_017646, partial [Xenoophorus captivus]
TCSVRMFKQLEDVGADVKDKWHVVPFNSSCGELMQDGLKVGPNLQDLKDEASLELFVRLWTHPRFLMNADLWVSSYLPVGGFVSSMDLMCDGPLL